MYGMLMKPRRPRAVVLCPTRELSEQVKPPISFSLISILSVVTQVISQTFYRYSELPNLSVIMHDSDLLWLVVAVESDPKKIH